MTRPPEFPWAPLPHRVGCFISHREAVAEATLRAGLSQRRYRVRLEPNNHIWQITEGSPLTVPPKDEP